jgi:hypothetical protein
MQSRLLRLVEPARVRLLSGFRIFWELGLLPHVLHENLYFSIGPLKLDCWSFTWRRCRTESWCGSCYRCLAGKYQFENTLFKKWAWLKMLPSLSQHCWVSLRKQTNRINSSPPAVVALVCTVSITSRASMMYYAHHCQFNMSFISSARSQKSLPKSL